MTESCHFPFCFCEKTANSLLAILSMKRQFVVFARPGQPNIIKEYSTIEHKTTEQIMRETNITNEVLFISTPLFRQRLPLDTDPASLYPDLVQNERPSKNSRPPFYITILPDDHSNESGLYLKVESQDPNIKLPDLEVVFQEEQMPGKNGMDFFELVKQSFYFESTDEHIMLNGVEIDYYQDAPSLIMNAKQLPLTYKCIIAEKDMKKVTLRINIVTEIQMTEITYIDGLRNILDYWEPKVLERRLLTPDEATQVFHDFPNIVQCHETFLNQLKERGNSYDAILSDVFLDFAAFFKVSQIYISNYSTIIEVIVEKTKNKYFTNQMKDLAANNPGGTGELPSFLITPVQRMPRYILFLRELIKATPESHPDSEMLKQAAIKIEAVTHEIDDASDAAETLSKLVGLQNSLLKPYELLAPSRKLLQEIPVFMTKPNNTQAKFYLFSDLVLITTVEKKGEIVVFDKEIVEFKYWSSYPTVESMQFIPTCKTPSLNYKGKIKEMAIKFNDVEQLLQIIKEIEQTKYKFYERNNTELTMTMLFKNCKLHGNIPLVFGTDGSTFEGNSFFFGGKLDHFLSNMFIYNHQAGTVNVIPTNVPPRSGHSMTFYKGNIIMFGGRNDRECFNDVWSFSCIENKWTQIVTKDQPEPRSFHSAILNVDYNEIIIFGGYDKKKRPLNSTLIYNIAQKSWTEVRKTTTDPEPRGHHSASYYEGRMYVYGGICDKKIFDDLHIFTISNQTWERVVPMGGPMMRRYMHKSYIVHNWLVIVGGIDENEVVEPVAVDLTIRRTTNLTAGGNNPPSLAQFALIPNKYDGSCIVFGGCMPDKKVATPNLCKFVLPPYITNKFPKNAQPVDDPLVLGRKRCSTRVPPGSEKRSSGTQNRAQSASIDPNQLATQFEQDSSLVHSDSEEQSQLSKDGYSVDGSSAAQPVTPPQNEAQSSSGIGTPNTGSDSQNSGSTTNSASFNMWDPSSFQVSMNEDTSKLPTYDIPQHINEENNNPPSPEAEKPKEEEKPNVYQPPVIQPQEIVQPIEVPTLNAPSIEQQPQPEMPKPSFEIPSMKLDNEEAPVPELTLFHQPSRSTPGVPDFNFGKNFATAPLKVNQPAQSSFQIPPPVENNIPPPVNPTIPPPMQSGPKLAPLQFNFFKPKQSPSRGNVPAVPAFGATNIPQAAPIGVPSSFNTPGITPNAAAPGIPPPLNAGIQQQSFGAPGIPTATPSYGYQSPPIAPPNTGYQPPQFSAGIPPPLNQQSIPQPFTPSIPQPVAQSIPQPVTPSIPQPVTPSIPQPVTQSIPQPVTPQSPTTISQPSTPPQSSQSTTHSAFAAFQQQAAGFIPTPSAPTAYKSSPSQNNAGADHVVETRSSPTGGQAPNIFNEKEYCEHINIDISSLVAFQQKNIIPKLNNLYNLEIENQRLEEQVAQAVSQASSNSSGGDQPLFIKVVDTQLNRIQLIPTNCDILFNNIHQIVQNTLGRNIGHISVSINGVNSEFNEVNFQSLISYVKMKKTSQIKLIAS